MHEWHKSVLHGIVPGLIAKWEPRLGVKVAGYFLQRMKTRWGSCNHAAGHIRLNTELVKKPKDLLEYVVVHENGKIHESLLATDISPTHLNLAFTLLRYPASSELYALPNETGGLSGTYPDVPEDVKSGARISIDVEWDDHGKTRRFPINDWIQHAVKTTAMPAEPWVYGGSGFYDGKFNAETTVAIAAIYLSQASLINYPGDDNLDDTVWLPFPKRVPEAGTNVTVIIAPFLKTPTLSKP